MEPALPNNGILQSSDQFWASRKVVMALLVITGSWWRWGYLQASTDPVAGILVNRGLRGVHGSMIRVRIYGRTSYWKRLKTKFKARLNECALSLCLFQHCSAPVTIKRLLVILYRWWGGEISSEEKQSSGSQYGRPGIHNLFPHIDQ